MPELSSPKEILVAILLVKGVTLLLGGARDGNETRSGRVQPYSPESIPLFQPRILIVLLRAEVA